MVLTWLGKEAFNSRVTLVPRRACAHRTVLDDVALCCWCTQVGQSTQVFTHSVVASLVFKTFSVLFTRMLVFRSPTRSCELLKGGERKTGLGSTRGQNSRISNCYNNFITLRIFTLMILCLFQSYVQKEI